VWSRVSRYKAVEPLYWTRVGRYKAVEPLDCVTSCVVEGQPLQGSERKHSTHMLGKIDNLQCMSRCTSKTVENGLE